MMMHDPEAIEKLRPILAQKCHYNPQPKGNFVMANDTIACFIDSGEQYHDLFLFTDTAFRVKTAFDIAAYIHVCGISRDAKYGIFQTCNSPISQDGEKLFLVTSSGDIVWSKETDHDWRGITSFYFDPDNKKFYEIHERDFKRYRYDIDGNLIGIDK